jgi:predicted MFS family arabinose efflux permease
VGVLLLGGLVFNEARVQQPIMPLRLFADRVRVGAYLTRLLYLGAMIGYFFFTTQYMQDVLGFSPLQAGFAFLPMTAINFAVALAVTRVIARIGGVMTLVAGVAVTFAGMVWLSRIGIDSNYWTAVALPLVLLGIGQGLAFAPMTSAGLHGVTGSDAGASSGLINTFHQLGSALGLSVVAAIGVAATSSGGTEREQMVQRASGALTGSAILLALALVAVLALIARGYRSTQPGTAAPESVEPIKARKVINP